MVCQRVDQVLKVYTKKGNNNLVCTIFPALTDEIRNTNRFEMSDLFPSIHFSLNFCCPLWCLSSFPFRGNGEVEGVVLAMSQQKKTYSRWRLLCIESIRAVQTLDCHWHLPGARFQLIFKGLHLLKPDYNPHPSRPPPPNRLIHMSDKEGSPISLRDWGTGKKDIDWKRIISQSACILLNEFLKYNTCANCGVNGNFRIQFNLDFWYTASQNK